MFCRSAYGSPLVGSIRKTSLRYHIRLGHGNGLERFYASRTVLQVLGAMPSSLPLCQATRSSQQRRLGTLTTSKARNTEFFKYRSTTAVEDIIEKFYDRKSAGAFTIGDGSTKACTEIFAASKGRNFVARASLNLLGEFPSSTLGWVLQALSIEWFSAYVPIKSKSKLLA